jgi:hypothetical protein
MGQAGLERLRTATAQQTQFGESISRSGAVQRHACEFGRAATSGSVRLARTTIVVARGRWRMVYLKLDYS